MDGEPEVRIIAEMPSGKVYFRALGRDVLLTTHNTWVCLGVPCHRAMDCEHVKAAQEWFAAQPVSAS